MAFDFLNLKGPVDRRDLPLVIFEGTQRSVGRALRESWRRPFRPSAAPAHRGKAAAPRHVLQREAVRFDSTSDYRAGPIPGQIRFASIQASTASLNSFIAWRISISHSDILTDFRNF